MNRLMAITITTAIAACSGWSTSAQDAKAAGKELKAAVRKAAPDLFSVKLDGCRVSFVFERGGPPEPRASGGGSVGGGFPSDEASNYLSAGSPADPTTRRDPFQRLGVNMARAADAVITTTPTRKNNELIFRIADTDAVEMSLLQSIPSPTAFRVRRHRSERLEAAFRSLAEVCSK